MIRTIVVTIALGLIGLQSAQVTGPQQLAWVDRTGGTMARVGAPQWNITDPAISPDATSIAVKGRDQQQGDADHIWIHDVVNGTKRRLTKDSGVERHSMWSPQGDRIVFYSMRNDNQADLFIRRSEGDGPDEPLLLSPDRHEYSPTWSPDGRYIAFHTHDPKSNGREIMYIDLAGDRKPQPLVQTPALEALPRFSPNGRSLAYQSDASGMWEVYVVPFPPRPGEAALRISKNGGVWPKWGGNNELFFFERNTLMSVRLNSQTPEPVKLFTGAQAGMGSGDFSTSFNPTYDVAPGGQRFAVVQRPKAQ